VQQPSQVGLRQAAALPVGARVLAPMVEEADVVVLLLERLDLALDEVIQLGQVRAQRLRQVVHLRKPLSLSAWCAPKGAGR
jgi:hypothetical protein